jgi:hypothetical protein
MVAAHSLIDRMTRCSKCLSACLPSLPFPLCGALTLQHPAARRFSTGSQQGQHVRLLSGCASTPRPADNPHPTGDFSVALGCCFNPGRSIVWRCLPHGCIVRRLCADWCGAGRNRCSGVWGGRVSRDAIPPCLAMSSRTPLQKWQSAVKSISTTRVFNMLLRNVLSLRVRPASAPAALALAHGPEVTSSATLLFAERGIYPT